MTTNKNFGFAAVSSLIGSCLVGCSEHVNKLPDMGASGAPQQGSTAPAVIEHVARVAVAGIEHGVGYIVAVVLLFAIPWLIFAGVTRFGAKGAEEPIEGALLVLAGIAGAILTAKTGLAPWYGAWIGAGIIIAVIGKGGPKWAIYITFDIALALALIFEAIGWGLSLSFGTKLIILLVGLVIITIGKIGVSGAKSTAN